MALFSLSSIQVVKTENIPLWYTTIWGSIWPVALQKKIRL
jgi:hypothetical protein